MPITETVFPGLSKMTHMPFFDGTTLVFCQAGAPLARKFVSEGSIWTTIRRNPQLAEQFKKLSRTQTIHYRPWKLSFCDWKDRVIYPIETGLPDNTVECSPSFYREGDKIYLSFVAATPSIKGLRYKLYLSSGPNFKKLHPAEQLSYRPLFFGFVSPSHTCWGTKSDLNVKEKASGNVFRIKTTFARIFRVTFLSELPSKLLITGRDDKFCDRTVLYDLTTEQSFDITADGDVYKSTIYGELLIFAKKNGEDFENRKLLVGDYLLERSSIKVLKESANA